MALLIPIAASLAAGVVSAGILWLFTAQRVARLAVFALPAQTAVAVAAWGIPSLLPRRTNWSGAVGDTCPDLDGILGHVLIGAGFTAAVLGGIALVAALIAAIRGVGRLRLAALVPASLGLPYVAFMPLVIAAFCGMN